MSNNNNILMGPNEIPPTSISSSNNVNVGDYSSIMGVPLEVALNIYQNDGWFDNSLILPSRFVIITNDNGDLKVEKKNSKENLECKQVSKIQFNLIEKPSKKQELINLCFSVWGNKGPYDVFVNLEKQPENNFPTENNKLAYLAHYAWIVSNDYSVDKDPVVNEVLRKMQTEPISKSVLYGILGINSPNYENKLDNILENNYFKEYISMYDNLNSEMSNYNTNNISNISSEKIEKLKNLLKLDLERAQLFVSKLKTSSGMSGGKRKNKKLTRKSSKKTSKKNKKSMRKH